MQLNDKYKGTLSHATMRAEDLIPTFVAFLLEVDHPQADEIKAEADALPIELPGEYKGDPPRQKLYKNCDPYELTGFWDYTTDVSWFLNETIWDALNDIAPEGTYFGAHPGDGSDYGYWAVEEDLF